MITYQGKPVVLVGVCGSDVMVRYFETDDTGETVPVKCLQADSVAELEKALSEAFSLELTVAKLFADVTCADFEALTMKSKAQEALTKAAQELEDWLVFAEQRDVVTRIEARAARLRIVGYRALAAEILPDQLSESQSK